LLRLEPKTFMGKRRRHWSSADLCVDISYYSAGTAFPQHGHVDPFFCFVLDGSCEEKAHGRREALRPGSLVYHPAGFEHSNHWHEAGRCMHVEFVQSFYDGIDPTRLSDSGMQVIGGRGCDIARNIYNELLHVDSASGIAFEGLALVLLAETIRESMRETKIPRWLYNVRERLLEEYMAAPPLRQMAAEISVHPTYLATSFQQHFGVTMGEFIRLRRIERAREMLVHSEEPLSAVAQSLGFSDQSHFGRIFKKQTGLTPQQFRRLFANHSRSVPEP